MSDLLAPKHRHVWKTLWQRIVRGRIGESLDRCACGKRRAMADDAARAAEILSKGR